MQRPSYRSTAYNTAPTASSVMRRRQTASQPAGVVVSRLETQKRGASCWKISVSLAIGAAGLLIAELSAAVLVFGVRRALAARRAPRLPGEGLQPLWYTVLFLGCWLGVMSVDLWMVGSLRDVAG